MNAALALAQEIDASPHAARCEIYLRRRTGRYEWRAVRYRAAAEAMFQCGLDDDSLVVDVGAGWTELDWCLRCEHRWRGRYHPIDGQLDGVDLNSWEPPRQADFFVALEILEHLFDPARMVAALQARAARGVIVSVPNPETTDVIGMDPTHVTIIRREFLESRGFQVEARQFYGQPADSLFGVWTPQRSVA